MPNQAVNGFTGLAVLGSGKKGLKNTNNSVSPVEVTGTGFAPDLPVNASNGAGVTWAGTLKSVDSKWKSNLTCTNNGKRIGDTEDVTVTVGDSSGFTTPVDVGT